ncbi:MAG: 50S ribosomal protein L35 [Calditrichaceae bacterium]|nr:50S ribosomal protein L35 [Calditrichaceae bacterium]MBN2709861.1 50S ribosomal protein L35 [Calditrichaceae bacterium]RQV92618.1 MAG: 50S ribosomal protein L35 [Calditrichota bacterium]
MPKMKSNRGASKRFRVTASGKIKRHSAYHSHILTKKSSKRRRNLRQESMVSEADAPKVRKMILK